MGFHLAPGRVEPALAKAGLVFQDEEPKAEQQKCRSKGSFTQCDVTAMMLLHVDIRCRPFPPLLFCTI
jgi:hypothetical protein